jgi:hypothetical protein
LHTVGLSHEVAHKFRVFAQVDAQHVVHHQHLTCCAIARANANGVASRQRLGEGGGQGGGHHFQHQHVGPGVLQGHGLSVQLGRSLWLASLHAVAAQGVHGLRSQPQMGAHRDAALDQKMHGLGGPATAFQLDHVGTGLHQHHGAAQGLFARLVISAKGQVANHPSRALHPAQPAHHAFGVVAHGLQAHTGGAGQTLAHHAQRVANQNALNPRRIGHGGKGGVIGGEHGDLVTLRARMSFKRGRLIGLREAARTRVAKSRMGWQREKRSWGGLKEAEIMRGYSSTAHI